MIGSTIEAEIADINRRLDRLQKEAGDRNCWSREIGELRTRVGEIERHLGISDKIAA